MALKNYKKLIIEDTQKNKAWSYDFPFHATNLKHIMDTGIPDALIMLADNIDDEIRVILNLGRSKAQHQFYLEDEAGKRTNLKHMVLKASLIMESSRQPLFEFNEMPVTYDLGRQVLFFEEKK